MKQDEIIEMAIYSGFYLPENDGVFDFPTELEAFAKLIAAKVRLDCFDAAYNANATTEVLKAIKSRGQA